jgi:hypothetical protein
MASILDPIPNSPFYSPQTYSISTPSGSLVLGSGVAVTPDGTLVVASALAGTVSQVTAGVGLSGGTITTTGTINLVPATNVSLGGIKVGANLLVDANGVLSALPPNTGTVSSITTGSGLTGGGPGPNVFINLNPASTTQLGGVVVQPSGGINVVGGSISLAQATTTDIGGSQLATGSEVIAGTNATKTITPATLAAKVATLLAPGLVQLSDSVAINDSTVAATQTAARTAFLAGTNAQVTANAALPKTGGVMTGIITFANGQTFPGVALPKATTSSLGVVQVGPGLSINSSGVLSTSANGTVTAVTAGEGLGSPATGNTISTSGTIRLLPPTGTSLGGVRAGTNVNIAFDGTISVPGSNFIASNNPFPFNGYIWPAALASPSLPFPGINGQVLTVLDNVAGTIGWTSTGTLQSVVAGPGLTVTSTPTTATVSLTTVPSITPGNVGGTALIPTLAVNQYGQITSTGLANPFAAFQTPTVTAPFILVMDFAGNNTNWAWTTNGNTTVQNPLNAVSGQTGSLLITQDPLSTYTITWGNSWKFGNFTPFTGAGLAEVTMLQFTVVASNYIVITGVTTNIG